MTVSRHILRDEPIIFERSSPGKKGITLPEYDVEKLNPEEVIPKRLLRETPPELPEVSEVEVVRHFVRLSQQNYGVDLGFYPLGSCTMKYNPKVNEEVASLPGFTCIHPYQPEELSQGALELIYELERMLSEISGMDAISLQPAAGAHGELTGTLIARAYYKKLGQKRTKVLIPDSAHGTNPASSAIAGFSIVELKTEKAGYLTPDVVKEAMTEDVAAIMITNPNTLGLFEEHILEISDIVHKGGGLVYMDGANLNALLGIAKPGDMGVDIMHFNLHKTFSTPHGGGGPGAGPVGVKKELEPFLPVPRIVKNRGGFELNYNLPSSIGRVRAFYGNFLVLVRAYAYILSLGAEGLRRCAETAVLIANYIRVRLMDYYHLSYNKVCMHEFVLTDKLQREYGAKTMDIAKRLIDYGFHPPTVYFPLVTSGAIMIEPTETESRDEIEGFIQAMIEIAKEAEANPELLKNAPHLTKVSRPDEVKAVREPRLRWKP